MKRPAPPRLFPTLPNEKLRAAPFFVIRSPLLAASESRPLQDLVADPVVLEALTRASPSLVTALRGERTPRPEVWSAIARYVGRMKARPTPFSLMAGYALGSVGGPVTQIELAERTNYRRIVRCSVAAIHDVAETTAASTWLRRADLVELPGVLRVVEVDPNTGDERSTDIGRTAALDVVLHAAREPSTLEHLGEVVAGGPATERHVEFVRSLTQAGLLVRADTPTILLDDESVALAAVAPEHGQLASRVRNTALGEPIDGTIEELRTALASTRPQDLIFDLHKPVTEARLGTDLVSEIIDVVQTLRRVSTEEHDLRVARFTEDFQRRYGDRTIGLTEALDLHRGIHFPSRAVLERRASPGLDAWKTRLFERACRSGAEEVVLDVGELPRGTERPFPESFSVVFSLSTDPLSIFNPRTLGAPGTQFFARGAAIHDELRDAARSYLSEIQEADPSVDYVDLAYYLASGVAFTQYPALQPTQIHVSGAAAPAGSIALDALSLRLDASGSLCLENSKTGRPVKVRMTGAMNANRIDVSNVLRFLSTLHSRRSGSWSFDWGPVAAASYLPRVRLRQHVLFPATWTLTGDTIAEISKASSRPARWDAAQRLRAERSLPSRVRFLERADHELTVDFDDPESVEGWLDGRLPSSIVLSEAPVNERSAVRGPEGPYAHELVVPMHVVRPAQESPPHRNPTEHLPTPARGPFGDRVTLVLRGDRQELLPVLAEWHASFIHDRLRQGNLAGWSFLPLEGHPAAVRCTLHGSRQELWSSQALDALNTFFEPHLESGALSEMALEGYRDETARLGGQPGAALARDLDTRSSELALRMHARFDFGAGSEGHANALVPAVASLRILGLASGLRIEQLLDVITQATDSLVSASEDRILVRRNAGALFRSHREAYEAISLRPDAVWEAERARFETIFAAFAEHADPPPVPSGVERFVLGALLDHCRRLWTPWHEVAAVQAMTFFVMRSSLEFDRARSRASADR